MTDSAFSFSSSILRSKTGHWLLLIIISEMLLFPGLGSVGLTDRDEGSNAEAAREMLETGDWISPTLNYEPRYAKPAFVYWLISGAYALGGVNEFMARFPSALCGLGLILTQYWFASRILSPGLALVAALMLLFNFEMVAICRMVLTDPALVLFTTLSAYSFWVGLAGKNDRDHRFMWLFYGAMGLAMLAKGPVGVIIPLLAVIPFLTVTRRWKQFWKIGHPILGTGLFLLIAAPWYVTMFAIHGADYAAAAQANTTGRFASPMEGHGGTLFFYIPVVFIGFFPWSGFLPAASYIAWRDWRAHTVGLIRGSAPGRDGDAGASSPDSTAKSMGCSHAELPLFLALWIASIFIFFTLSATRLPHYVFPLFPAASLLTTVYVTRSLAESPLSKGFRISLQTMLVIGYVLGLAFAAVPAIYEAFIPQIVKEFPAASQVGPGWSPIVAGATFITGTLLIRHFGIAEAQWTRAFGIACGMMLCAMLVIILVTLPRFSLYFLQPPQELATIAGLNLEPQDRLVEFGRKRPSLVFYAKRKIFHINPGEDEQFAPHLEGPGRTMIITQNRLYAQLPESVSDFQIILKRHGFLLLANRSMLKEPAQ